MENTTHNVKFYTYVEKQKSFGFSGFGFYKL